MIEEKLRQTTYLYINHTNVVHDMGRGPWWILMHHTALFMWLCITTDRNEILHLQFPWRIFSCLSTPLLMQAPNCTFTNPGVDTHKGDFYVDTHKSSDDTPVY